MGVESVTFLHLYDGFYVNSFFDRSIYRPMCTHMGQQADFLFSYLHETPDLSASSM